MTSTSVSTPSRYLRWGGLAAAVGSLLVIVGAYWGKFLEAGSDLHEFTAQPAFVAAVAVGMLGALTLVFGVLSLSTAQLGDGDGWALAGLVGGVVGPVMLLAGLFAQGIFFPTLAVEAPEFLQQLSAGEVSGPVGPGILVSSVLQTLGLITFGVATIRADVFSTWAGAALIVGAVLIAIPVTGSNLVVLGTLIWMGVRLATGRVQPTQSTRQRVPGAVEHSTAAAGRT